VSTTTDDPDQGWYPENFVNPADDPEIPWVVTATDEDPVPPADRLAEEPVEVQVAPEDPEDDPNDNLALALRGDDASFPVVPDGEAGPRGFVQPGFGGLDLRDYSRNPQQKGWGAPCSAARATVRLSAAAVTVDARVAELVGLIMRACEARGYIFRAADTGAYNCRYISGTTVWSNHAWALAVDVNWQSNPYTTRWATDIPDWMHNLWNRYGFAWGGDYTGGRRDFMHFEFMGSPQQAGQALALARAELAGGAPVPAPPPAPAGIPRPPVLAWPLPAGHWFGNVTGPAKQHGGDRRWDSQAVHEFVQNIQEHLIFRGCAGGNRDWRSRTWDDGLWGGPTDTAMILFHRLFYGGQQYPAQCWRDDYQRLVSG
jgi:hypothetical protein